MKSLLKAVNISKNYNELSVLKSIDLEIDKQEIVTILGPSGAGKTTLLHILGTLDKPNSNYESKLYYNGINTSLLGEKELSKFRNQNIGFIFQFHELLPEFSALEKNRNQISIIFIILYLVVTLILILISIIIGIGIAQRIVNPISSVIKASNKISKGNYNDKVERTNDYIELNRLADSFNSMSSDLIRQRKQFLVEKV